MKVGTDSVLLAAVVMDLFNKNTLPMPKRVLDVGTGCGILSLCMAQTFAGAEIFAIDIDKNSVLEASDNFNNSPWPNRLHAIEIDLQSLTRSNTKVILYHEQSNTEEILPHKYSSAEEISHQQHSDTVKNKNFDFIISNPPYFENSLLCPKSSRANARHTTTLTLEDFVLSCEKLSHPQTKIAVILPIYAAEKVEYLFLQQNFHPIHKVDIFPKPNTPAKRRILILSKENFNLSTQTTAQTDQQPSPQLTTQPDLQASTQPDKIESEKILLRSQDGQPTTEYKNLVSNILL